MNLMLTLILGCEYHLNLEFKTAGLRVRKESKRKLNACIHFIMMFYSETLNHIRTRLTNTCHYYLTTNTDKTEEENGDDKGMKNYCAYSVHFSCFLRVIFS